jgi:uncharacterized protein YjbI with pentapeptide repeats
MPRRRAPAAAGLQPPELPATLSPAAEPVMLFDGASFAGALLVDADLSASQAADLLLDRVVCRRVRFTQSELTLAQLTDVQLDGCDLAGATLSKAQLRRVELLGCRLLGAALLDARLDDVLVQRGNGESLRCWSSTLRAVRFERCDLRAASFVGSDLSGVVFHDCDLTGADFRDATMRGADLRGSALAGVQLGVRELQGTIVSPAQAVELAQVLGLTVLPEEAGGAA